MKGYKKLLAIILICLLTVIVGCSGGSRKVNTDDVLYNAALDYFAHIAEGNNNMITSQDLKDILEDGERDVLIIDIRSEEDFNESHIEGAVHAERGELANLMERIPRDKEVVIACYSGQNAGYTIAYLRMAGFDNVSSLLLGIDLGWVGRHNYKLEGSGPNPLSALPKVSKPLNNQEKVIWDRAKEYGKEIAEGNIGFIPLNEHIDIFIALLDDPDSYLVLDMRSEADYQAGSIEHSRHIEWGDFGDILDIFPTSMPVVLACYSGQTAAQTLGVLRMLGIENVYNMTFGVRDGWVSRNGLPTTTAGPSEGGSQGGG